MTRRQPPQQPPPAQRLRVQYAKQGIARYASHRDFGRALERALRRAGVPMAYSSGFNPHPRISYAGAAPTGAASLAEYAELALAARCDPERVRESLTAALPTGFDVLRVVEARGGALADRIEASVWQIELPGVDEQSLTTAAGAVLAADRVEVTRHTKKGDRVLDARAAIVGMVTEGCILTAVVRNGKPLVRPMEVVSALCACTPGLVDRLDVPRSTRLAQGPLRDGVVKDPFGQEE